MGVHSKASPTVPRVFELPLNPRMLAVADATAHELKRARRFGWDSCEADWRRLIERDDIDLIDICTLGSSHALIAIAALRAGKTRFV